MKKIQLGFNNPEAIKKGKGITLTFLPQDTFRIGIDIHTFTLSKANHRYT
nr:hypothetical protein [Desulforamulus aquiferis]